LDMRLTSHLCLGGNRVKLKGRLKLIYDMIPQCDILCDIGTDHALIPAYALLNKRCRRAIATDIGKGPLVRAEQTLKAYNLQSMMDLRLGNGLEVISMDEADVIVIAGMGGVLITELLGDQLDKAKKAKRIILQPMYAQEVVRPFLWQNGFTVTDEALTREGRKLYQVLAVVYDEAASASCMKDPVYEFIGEGLINNRDPLLEDWLCDRIKRQRKIVNGMRSAALPRPNLEQEEELLRDLESLQSKLFSNRGM
jgi:tRNA (adenine22-N1)-methyltransferase